MEWSWIRLEERLLTVQAGEGFRPKNLNERPVPLPRDVIEVLHRRRALSGGGYVFAKPGGTPYTSSHIARRFKGAVKRAGLGGEYTFHILRHTYASRLAEAGVDLYRIKELLGHADVETTLRYAHLSLAAMQSAVDRTFG
jgi:integrase